MRFAKLTEPLLIDGIGERRPSSVQILCGQSRCRQGGRTYHQLQHSKHNLLQNCNLSLFYRAQVNTWLQECEYSMKTRLRRSSLSTCCRHAGRKAKLGARRAKDLPRYEAGLPNDRS